MPPIEITALDRFFAESLLGSKEESETFFALSKLMAASRQGHLCVSEKRLFDSASVLDPFPLSIVGKGLEFFPKTPIVQYQGCYYLQRNWVYETHLVQETKRIRAYPPPSWLDLEKFKKELPLQPLLPAQRQAIEQVSQCPLSIFCGGPGSGKTYTASYLIALLSSALKREKKSSLQILLTAPTGKAASHLHATIQKLNISECIESATLHRLLQLTPGQEKLFAHRFLDADVVLVDEASMIDVSLMAHLLESIGEETLVVLIGDPHQLPPIESGSIFPEMAGLFGSYLDQCMRTEKKELQSLATAVKTQDLQTLSQCYRDIWIPLPDKEELYKWIQPFFSEEMPDPEIAAKMYSRRRILCPIRKGKDGIDALNTFFFERISASKAYWAIPILATSNDSWTGIYNGMNGILIGRGRDVLAAYFPTPKDGGKMDLISPIPPYEIAFCLSIHKSQGSEYDEVLAFFPQGSESFGKEGLYTAITRARKKLLLSGSEKTLMQMVQTPIKTESNFTKRYTDAVCVHSSEPL
ncbi:MAG: AAA family ATPase [Chlamydiia bacterium]|nr:AAA family ATPase [Chlamydiia bacterium]